MKKCDLGIVLIHWLMFVSLISVSASGLLLYHKEFQPYFAWLFPPANMGPIHIWVSVFVVIFLLSYVLYVHKANLLNRFKIPLHGLIVRGQIRWKYVSIFCYWLVFYIIIVETLTGILLTRLINWNILAEIFFIQKSLLLFLHYYLVWVILSFPVVHIIIHWVDGGRRKIAAIFRPQVFPRRPTLVEVTVKLKEENTRLKERLKHDKTPNPRNSPNMDDARC